MTTARPLLTILAAALFGSLAHAGDFSLGGAQLLAEASAQPDVDVNVHFTDRGRAMRDTSEGGDAAPARDSRHLRGTDDVSTPSPARGEDVPKPKQDDAAPGADAPHGVSISPAAAVRRPSYRWQSLVPGTIK
jgi:hypothetical protein